MNCDVYIPADRFPLVRDIGWNRTDSLYTHHDRILDFNVFLFVAQGCMQVIEEGTEYFVKRNEHLFLKEGCHHWGLPATEPGTSWYWIHFNAPVEGSLAYREHPPIPELEYCGPEHYRYRIPLPKHGTSSFHERLAMRLEALASDYRTPGPHSMTHVSLRVCQLFLELQAIDERNKHRQSGKSDTIAGRVIAYLLRHAEEEFDSAKVAGHLNLNYSYLSAAFKEQTGQTIVDAHTRLRMNKAIEWMRSSSLNVSEISERLGYRNPYYFSRVFKKVLGEAPSSYMRHFYKP